MIPIPSGVRVWIATGHTDMRRGMNSLALLVQIESVKLNGLDPKSCLDDAMADGHSINRH